MERWNASQKIQEAKKLEKDKDYRSAVVRYNEGIEQLQGVLEGKIFHWISTLRKILIV